MAAQTLVTRRRLRRRRYSPAGTSLFKIVALTLLLVVPVGVLVASGAAFGTYQHYADGYEPMEEVLVERPAGLTRVYDRSGAVELGVLNNPIAPLAQPVELDEISPHLILATVSTEDNAFWDHPGVNVRGVMRAVQENYFGAGGFGTGSGGSSITQQLVKNVYICPSYADAEDPCVAERTVDRKLREMAYALQLEQDHSKEQILNWYLNQISYGDRYIGAEAASHGYFRKSADELTLGEAALLAGIPSAPQTYHPRLNCVLDENDRCVVDPDGRVTVGGASKERQEYVLQLMVEHEHISAAEAADARDEAIKIHPSSGSDEQRASAFLANQVEPRLVRMCESGELPLMPGAENCATSVASGGWSVRTTLDWERNEEARALLIDYIERGLERGCDCHNAAIVTIEPDTGEITTYVPNIDQSETEDRRVSGQIDQLVEINQPGSALKPAIYLAWFDSLGKTPASTLWDTSPLPLDPEEDVVEEGVEIVNPRPGGGGEGLITARSALGGSQNVPAFRAAQEVGIANLFEMARALGIGTLAQSFDPTFLHHPSVTYGPSVATGGANIRAIDLAYMNATIANMGVMVGLPHGATYVNDTSELSSIIGGDALSSSRAEDEKAAFQLGHLRLPDSRPLDPIAILEVRDSSGAVIYAAPEPERIEVVNAGSAWLLHSIMSDCQARWIIWQCGTSNDDTRLDVFVDGERLPGGVKTGTQQGPTDRDDVLASWVTGYSRHAATVAWVGNANKSLILDGPAAGYASSHTVLHIYKEWMADYHRSLQEAGRVEEFLGFDDIQPDNVVRARFPSPTTERGHWGGCYQQVMSWQRTDIDYDYDCENGAVYLPDYKRDEAIQLARSRGITTSATRWTPPPAPVAPAQPTPVPTASSGPTATVEPDETATPGAGEETPAPEPTPANTPVPQPTAANTAVPQPTQAQEPGNRAGEAPQGGGTGGESESGETG